MPKLSIITINLNNKAGLQKTIDSVISQSYKDFEWIIIDGGSTDGSKELIEKYSAHITYLVSEPDKGIYAAMNKGVKVARGEYLQFLNSGDCLYDENVVADFVNRNNTEDVIYGNALFVDAEGKEVKKWQAPALLKLSDFWTAGINHQATFFNKRCFKQYEYNETNKIVSDSELLMTLLYNSFVFVKYDRFLVKYDNTGISTKITNIDEMRGVRNRVLPLGVRADYEDILKFRDVDLYIMIKKIVSSNKFYRHLTRLFLYPIYYLCKWTVK